MKGFIKSCVLAFSLIGSSQAFAAGESPAEALEEKIYIDTESLFFSNEGIFVQLNTAEWLQVNQIHYDAEGYFIPQASLSTMVAAYEDTIWDY